MRIKKYLVHGLLLTLSSAVSAIDLQPLSNSGNNDPNGNLSLYLQNLGKYFGYDITQFCDAPGSCGSNTSAAGAGGGTSPAALESSGDGEFTNRLLNSDMANANEISLFGTFLGAMLGNPGSEQSIIPNNAGSPYSVLNALSVQTFLKPPYNNPAADKVTVSELIDQKTYQTDPVSQAVLNLLSTPASSFCMNPNSTSMASTTNPECDYLNRSRVMSQVIGPIPKPFDFFSSNYTQKVVAQLNSDTLLLPLLFTTEPADNHPTSSGGQNTNTKGQGLQAKTQAQQAANFIRYVSSQVNPFPLPELSQYQYFFNRAGNFKGDVPAADQRIAATALNNFHTKLRSYSAQLSVGISNLYYIFSKRLPQTPPGQDQPTSQAMDEFKMATWRIYNPSASSGSAPGQKQWLNMINKASAATVQKEMAVLLAEINYQMYLTRQQQERQLLTASIILLQNSINTQAAINLDS